MRSVVAMKWALVALGLCLVTCKTAGKRTPTGSREQVPTAPVAAPSVVPSGGETLPEAMASAAPLASGAPSAKASLEEIRGFVVTSVKAGYETRDEIVRSAVDVLAEDMPGIDVKGVATRQVDEELAAQRRREATWTAPTDCDRLDRVFARLEKSGIVARQNFSDCGTCGAAEIAEEIERLIAAGKKVRGYVFFHQQDSEGALDGSLYLSYGHASEESEAAQLAIAREVVAALKAGGLHVTWNGTLDMRVGISPIEWRKRRFTPAPAMQ
jgi:hypothetical protein